MKKIRSGVYRGKNKDGQEVEIHRAGVKWKGNNVWRVYIEGDYKGNLDSLSFRMAKKRAGVIE